MQGHDAVEHCGTKVFAIPESLEAKRLATFNSGGDVWQLHEEVASKQIGERIQEQHNLVALLSVESQRNSRKYRSDSNAKICHRPSKSADAHALFGRTHLGDGRHPHRLPDGAKNSHCNVDQQERSVGINEVEQ